MPKREVSNWEFKKIESFLKGMRPEKKERPPYKGNGEELRSLLFNKIKQLISEHGQLVKTLFEVQADIEQDAYEVTDVPPLEGLGRQAKATNYMHDMYYKLIKCYRDCGYTLISGSVYFAALVELQIVRGSSTIKENRDRVLSLAKGCGQRVNGKWNWGEDCLISFEDFINVVVEKIEPYLLIFDKENEVNFHAKLEAIDKVMEHKSLGQLDRVSSERRS